MTLKLRGRTQFLDNSIGLQKLVTISSGKIIGRSLADSGDGPLKELSVSETRTNLGLNTDSTGVSFGDISGADLDMSGQTLTLTGLTTTDSNLILDNDSISGNKIHGGNIGGGFGSLGYSNEQFDFDSRNHFDDHMSQDTYARHYGRSVALSSDGNVMVIGSWPFQAYPRDNGISDVDPNVFRYEWNSSTSSWDFVYAVALYHNYYKSTSYDHTYMAWSLDLNSDGSLLAVGWPEAGSILSTIAQHGAGYFFKWNSTDQEWKWLNGYTNGWDEMAPITSTIGGKTVNRIYLSRNHGNFLSSDGAHVHEQFESEGAPRRQFQSVSMNGDGTKVVSGTGAGKADYTPMSTWRPNLGQVSPNWEGHGYIQTFFWTEGWATGNGIIDSISDADNRTYPTDSFATIENPVNYTEFYEWEHSRLSAPTNSVGFGMSCAMSDDGNLLVVGAPYTSINGDDHCGIVYTYDWNSTTHQWDIRSETLQLDTPSEGDNFGMSLALSGDGERLAVSATGETQSNEYAQPSGHGNIEGEVYIYDLGSGGNWILNESISREDSSSGDLFGRGLAFNQDGRTLMIGAPGYELDENYYYSDQGILYQYNTGSSTSNISSLSFSGSELTVSNSLIHIGDSYSPLKSSNVDINGGNIDGTIIGSNSSTEGTFTDLIAVGTGSSSLNNVVIGNNTPASGAFTTLDSTTLSVGSSDELSISNAGVLSTSGTLSSTDNSGTSSFSGNFTVGGNLTVEGTTTTIDTENLIVQDTLAKFGDGNSGDLKDLGFYSEYVNNSSETKYAGIFRDATVGEFKLFNDFGTEPSENVVGDISSSIGTLHANITGDVTGDLTGNAGTTTEFETNRSFTVSGDVSTSMSHNFKGTQDVNLSVSMNNSVVDFANIHDDVVVTSVEDLSNFDSDVMIVTAAAVRDYVEENLLRGGSSVTLESTSIKMIDSNDEFIRVKKHFQRSLIDADDVVNEYVSITTDLESDFSGLAEVFLNGQKIASGTSAQVAAGTKDYYFDTSSSNNHKIYMDPDFMKSGDKLEIIYYILAT